VKKGLLILAVLLFSRYAWAEWPVFGGEAVIEPASGGSGVFAAETLQYHSIFRDGRLYYWYQGAGTRIYTATRFSPTQQGRVDSVVAVVWAARAMSPSPTDTFIIYRDTSAGGGSRRPGSRLSSYAWSFNAPQAGAFAVKIRFSTPFIFTGQDFWAGYLGMQGTNPADSLRTCTDTTTTTTATRQFISTNSTTWARADTVGVPYDWGVTLFVEYGSGVEVLTPSGPVSLPPKLYPASPHPFRNGGDIAYDLPKASGVELALYDLSGRLVRILDWGERYAGHHVVRWDGLDNQKRPAASGVYLCSLRAGSLTATRSLVIIR